MKLSDMQLKRIQIDKEETRKRIQSDNKLYNALRELRYGIEPESLHEIAAPEKMTAAEKRMNVNTSRNNFQTKVYNLFDDDSNDSNYFIANFNNDYDSFNVIYPQLVKLFKGKNSDPDNVLRTSDNLIDNLKTTGSMNNSNNNNAMKTLLIQQTQQFQQYFTNQIANGVVPDNNKTKDINKLLEAILHYEESYDALNRGDKSRWKSARTKISEDINVLLEAMVSNKDKQVKLNDIAEIMTDVKSKIVNVANDMSNEEKRAASKTKKEEKLNKAQQKIIDDYNKRLDKLNKRFATIAGFKFSDAIKKERIAEAQEAFDENELLIAEALKEAFDEKELLIAEAFKEKQNKKQNKKQKEHEETKGEEL